MLPRPLWGNQNRTPQVQGSPLASYEILGQGKLPCCRSGSRSKLGQVLDGGTKPGPCALGVIIETSIWSPWVGETGGSEYVGGMGGGQLEQLLVQPAQPLGELDRLEGGLSFEITCPHSHFFLFPCRSGFPLGFLSDRCTIKGQPSDSFSSWCNSINAPTYGISSLFPALFFF